MASAPIKSGLLIVTTLILGWLGAVVINDMRDAANLLDDRRAVRAATAALSSVRDNLSSTVRDNAVWDDAFAKIQGPGAVDWIFRNWGRTTEDYPLYDGVIVTAPDGSTTSAYWKGEALNDSESFSTLNPQLHQSLEAPSNPHVSFISSKGRVILAASAAIRPYSHQVNDGGLSVLTFLKVINADAVAKIASDHQLVGLHLTLAEPESGLNVALDGFDKTPVAWLAWPSAAPGTQIYSSVRPLVAITLGLLGLYLFGISLAGAAETRELRRQAWKSRYEAMHDPLTGLHNRSGLVDELRQSLVVGQGPACLHIIDIDGFKAVNDAWGHAVGDELIKRVASTLENIHPDVTVVARIGGDKFAILQSFERSQDEVNANLLSALSVPFHISGRTIEIGASIGFVTGHSGEDAHELIRRADIALYRAKAQGRSQAVRYSPELDRIREERASLEAKLRHALHHDQIQPVFQPLVCARTGKIRGVEALARWLDPEGQRSPDLFIPLAERCGLIDTLGLQMIRKSMRAISGWQELGLSVNVSPIQLCNPNFSAAVLKVLSQEGFDARRLTLEITESVLMKNPEQAQRSITVLKAAGIRFALDDFGCGYASIGTLRAFGFDRMKIDRSLVVAAAENASGRDVLYATIALATALSIPVTAEGIETSDQADMVRAAGCDQLQGYMLGKPMPLADLEKALAAKVANWAEPPISQRSATGLESRRSVTK
ncbi:bifunctional diguanylate cyclase/phosphodiesterase [Rhizobium sp. FY34]|uniref:bifunctional diguanylate cyclase/phosphodiesterase n=1 Tax=Rhizobium sp. FY34 TaxID=2562309 RepID=UPI001FF02F88|nr:bifunctional diguanylate cyclase/phosphodiesterase [Rhizobium sp. FY34]